MKAVIKECYSTDVDDLFDYKPDAINGFDFPLRFVIGPKDALGGECFDVLVCNLAYFQNKFPPGEVIFGRHLLIVQQYDFNNILDFVAKYVTSLEEDTWDALANKLARIGKWEFEDYRPYTV
ncbi:Imm8 family immunity protein [Spirosoma endbachense]|uniref:Uncharacterized protein n=1 Tax=Spirosoma endbachense TaxID=2666025 RepID=A0A6P1VMR3_9BACT|nr:Imm8 family immunity protein [Spirosoma endbachense]QHV93874.1 hypothetical protein GJR95_02020 [Spirosoma endbachense]